MYFPIRTKLAPASEFQINSDWGCFADIRKHYTTIVTENDNIEDIQALHSIYIRELYKDRVAPVIPFDRYLILATFHHCLDKNKKSEFLKE